MSLAFINGTRGARTDLLAYSYFGLAEKAFLELSNIPLEVHLSFYFVCASATQSPAQLLRRI